MNQPNSDIQQLAQQLATGQLSIDQFMIQVNSLQTQTLDNVALDLDRARRCGFPEVIYGEGKDAATIAEITTALLANHENVLATRVEQAKADVLLKQFPDAIYSAAGRTFRIAADCNQNQQPIGKVMVVTAGTSDLPVAEEAAETLTWMQVNAVRIRDVGVAGPQRLRQRLKEFENADAVIVAAGMEGALPSVVGGYVDCPVIAVPTSVGYGAAFGGVAALLGMLNSCSANVIVVNIDAGFKAAFAAGMIAHRIHKAATQDKT